MHGQVGVIDLAAELFNNANAYCKVLIFAYSRQQLRLIIMPVELLR